MNALGDVQRRRLKYVATINDDALGEETEPDYELQYIDIGNVDSSGTVHEIATHRYADAPSQARRRVRDGDVIISCVRTYLQAIAPIQNPPDNLIVSTGFAVVRPRVDTCDPEFCKYALREPAFLAEVEKRSVGVSYPAINASDLGDIPVYLPPPRRQRAIADYLDRETARLDALMAAKERVIALLAEKRRASITRAVTRGVDLSAPLRDSGIPWLGEIPAHWQVERTRWLFRERDERSEAGEEELLTVSHLTGVTPRSEKDVNMFEAETTEGYKICLRGDLVINTLWAWMGAMGVSRVDGIVSPAYNVYRPGPRLDPTFIDALVRIPVFAQEVIRYSKGVWASRLRLYPEGFFEVFFPVPPREEQRAIVTHIAAETAKLDAMRSATERTIFGDPQHVDDDGFDWVSVDSRHRLRRGMFVAQVVGKSMEPAIPDGSYCVFAAPVEGTRQGKTVLVQLRDATDPETGERYTVKQYESEKEKHGDSWHHTRIILKPLNPEFQPIVLTGADEQQLQVVAELVEVLTNEA